MKKIASLLLFLTFLVLLMNGFGSSPSSTATPVAQEPGKTIIVSSTADSGYGTLRQALLDAQSGDVIIFDPEAFPPRAPVVISLASGLPPITQGNLTVNASNAGVILDGSKINDEGVNGFNIASDGNIIRGLQVLNFPNAAIGPEAGAQNNTIGGDRNIGDGPLGQGNLLSGHGSFGVGIWDADTSFNIIIGNYIGTDLSGTVVWGIQRDGVHINGASRNQMINNLISGNGQSGVYICCKGEENVIRDNHIGTDISGFNPLGNVQGGVCIDQGARNNLIGPDNVIAYNNGCGVAIFGPNSLGNVIVQNSIRENAHQGIYLWDGGNTELTAPFIRDFDLSAGTLAGETCANCKVEFFSDDSNQGKVFEGQTTADGAGFFTFKKGASLIGPHLTATATDEKGNTSGFSLPTSGTGRRLTLQEGNELPKTQLQTKQSRELENNCIGDSHSLRTDIHTEQHADSLVDLISNVGQKWVVLSIDYFDWDAAETTGEYSKYYIDPNHDKAITGLDDNGIKLMYLLNFWDEEIQPEKGYARFKKEEEIQRYLDYAQFIVHNFKDRIEYYCITNEPNFDENPYAPFNQQNIELADYINLVKRVATVIYEEYPEAKIIVGNNPNLKETNCRDYLFGILESGIMPLVDAISWNPMFGASPEYDYYREYYYNYPSIVQEIKDVASAHGFKGEYIAWFMCWRTPMNASDAPEEIWIYSETVSAKYYARSIVMHLGMGVTAGLGALSHEVYAILNLPKMIVVRNLCTIMAGTEPTSLSIEIQSEATNIRNYNFSLPNGEKLFALWTDGVAVDADPGVEAILTFPGIAADKVMGIDVLNSFEQEIITDVEDGNLVVRGLLVKDYPIILRFTDTTP